MTKLFVIPGHGAGDSGACGNGYEEAERVRALATKIKQFGGDNVILADFSRNYYADGGINYLDISKDIPIVELHMDSGGYGAKGGHVIIQAGVGGADKYDRNIEAMIKRIFPGRASTLVERDDLANPARAAARGYNYRLVENGFISDAGDVATFNSRINDIAQGYLQAFGIPVKGVDVNAWPLILWPSNGGNNQKFKLEKKGDFYVIRNKANDKVLDVSDNKVGSDVILYKAKATGNDNQLWKLVKVDDFGMYEIESKLNKDYVLDAKGNDASDGEALCCWKRNKQANQRWHLMANGDGTYTIVSNMKRKLVLDAANGGK